MRLETIRPEIEYRLKIRPRDEALAARRRMEGRLVLRTDHPRYARVDIPVTLVPEPEVVAIPSELLVPASSGASVPIQWSLLLRSCRERPFEVLGAEVPGSRVPVSVAPRGTNEYVLSVGRLGSARDSAGKALRVRVRTARGEEECVEIPIRPDTEGRP